ncbi:MAG TPA: sodium:proton antiporter [Candidatus Omnitrophota bacterium]|nr:sodium:proton antiporter [Candidatus Omnitrophota bacterium]
MHSEWIPQIWMVLPFVGLLLSIALFPLFAPAFWHRIRNQAMVSALFSLPVIFLCGRYAPHKFLESMEHYVSFVILLGALFTVSGGIHLAGHLKNTPRANTALLGAGAILSNLVGTTGASMVLIRPLLSANAHRRHHAYLPIFFIMVVSNASGMLTPLGDPPLFLGYLLGVPFFWTLKLFPIWFVSVSFLLIVFYFIDKKFHRKTPAPKLNHGDKPAAPKIYGKRSFACLVAVVAAVFLPPPVRELVMVAAALTAYKITPSKYHRDNDFNFMPIQEVAVLFLGIFITMVPALELLRLRGGELGVTAPWQFFWSTGGFSSVLDNAPTYLTFVALGQGLGAGGPYLAIPENILMAISAGAVLFGACTYIGNAPNFMVRSIAAHRGWKMPSFFGYLFWSLLFLIPLFMLLTVLFFRG